MKKTLLILVFPAAFLLACSGHAVKEGINNAGSAAGETATEFIKGVGKGIDAATEVKVNVARPVLGKGLSFGKSTVSSDSGGTDNVLNVYVIYNNDFSGTLTAKVFDEKQNEVGRSSTTLNGKKNDAGFVTFRFDNRTNIDSGNQVIIE